jgi:hypothetical protein
MTDRSRRSLDDELAMLSRDVAPPRNLWPTIVRGIARAPRPARPIAYAVAASVVAACLATALTWVVLKERPTSTPARGATANILSSFDEPRDSGYVAARTALRATFQERLKLLDPSTRSQIESSLAVIRKAREDIHRALAASPDSPVLEQLLEATWHDEFDLYDDVVRTSQPILART